MRPVHMRKFAFTIVAALCAIVGGTYLSGLLSLLLLDLDIHRLQWNTYFQYLHALDLPQVRPYVGRIKAAGYLGFGMPAIAGLALAVRPAGLFGR